MAYQVHAAPHVRGQSSRACGSKYPDSASLRVEISGPRTQQHIFKEEMPYEHHHKHQDNIRPFHAR